VVLIVVDTLRADHLSTYGYARPTSPHLDRLAEDALVYENAFTVMSHTLPAHVSLMTGVHPSIHKVLSNGWRYEGPYPTLAERLREVGYETAAFVSGFPLSAASGLDVGFDLYREARNPRGERTRKIRGERTNLRAIRWLESRGSRPFFLFVHYFDTHGPFLSGGRERSRFQVDEGVEAHLREIGASGLGFSDVSSERPPTLDGEPLTLPAAINAYDNQIHAVDALISDLLAALEGAGLADRSLIIITADHGEGLGQHRYFSHGRHLYEEQIRIPLIVRPPEGTNWEPGRIDSTVSLLDIAPTVLELAGLPASGEFHGRALPLSPSSARRPARWIVAQRRHYPMTLRGRRGGGARQPNSLRAIRGDDAFKYLRRGNGKEELYDLSRDPGELHNVAEAHPAERERLRLLMDDLLPKGAVAKPTVEPEIDEETREQLEALGYF
jgi:arylsulfatase